MDNDASPVELTDNSLYPLACNILLGSSKEYAGFEKLAKSLVAVPKTEIEKREAEYQRQKKAAKKKEGRVRN